MQLYGIVEIGEEIPGETGVFFGDVTRTMLWADVAERDRHLALWQAEYPDIRQFAGVDVIGLGLNLGVGLGSGGGANANLLLSPNDLSGAAWSQDAPSGSATASTVTFTGAGNDYRYQQYTTIPGRTYRHTATLSAAVKTLVRFGDIVNSDLQSVVLTTTPTLVTNDVLAAGVGGYAGFDNRIAQSGDGIAGTITVTGMSVVLI